MTDKLIIRKLNEVYVQIFASTSTCYELSDHFTFTVPGARFHPKVKARVWDGKIRLYNMLTHTLYAGLIHQVEKFAKDRNYEIEYEYENNDINFSVVEAKEFIDSLKIPKQIVPSVHEHQLDAFVHSIRKSRLLLLSATSSGKSLIIYLLTRFYNAKTLIIVPTVTLVHQLASDFGEYGFDSNKRIHKIVAGKPKKAKEQITISTWQSIYKQPKEYFDQFDLVIGDEAHLYKAKSLVDIMSKLEECKYRFGLTGTLDGTLTNQMVLEGLFGPIRKVISTSEMIDKGLAPDLFIKTLVLDYTPEEKKLVSKMTYADEVDFICRHQSRLKYIKNLALSLKGNTLILSAYVDKHARVLYEMLNDVKDRKVFFVYGGVDGEIRNEIRSIVEKEENAIIVATYGTLSTGVNIKRLNNLIFASPSKSIIRVLQSIGRTMRKLSGKANVTLFDIADNLQHKATANYTLVHYKERVKIYVKEGFNYKTYKIGLH